MHCHATCLYNKWQCMHDNICNWKAPKLYYNSVHIIMHNIPQNQSTTHPECLSIQSTMMHAPNNGQIKQNLTIFLLEIQCCFPSKYNFELHHMTAYITWLFLLAYDWLSRQHGQCCIILHTAFNREHESALILPACNWWQVVAAWISMTSRDLSLCSMIQH